MSEREGERTVVFVSAVTGHGGPNASLRVVLPRLKDVRPVLVGPYDESEAAEWKATGMSVERIPRPRGPWRLAMAAIRLLGIFWRLRRRRPQAFANGLTEAVVLAPSLVLFSLRAMVWVHNYTPPRAALTLAPVLARVPRERVQLAAVSQVAAQVGRRVFGEAAEFTVLPNPIEQGPAPESAHRRSTATHLRVAYVAGTDRAYKGFDLLPDIIAASDGCELDWLIVAAEATQPDAWRRLRETMERLQASTVTIRGRTPRVEDVYLWTDVVLVPSRQESFCRVAAEAMSCGAAIVASRLPAIEEVCGDVAHYFDPGDPEGAAGVLRRLREARWLVDRAGELGRLRARRFATEKVVEQFDQLLQKVSSSS